MAGTDLATPLALEVETVEPAKDDLRLLRSFRSDPWTLDALMLPRNPIALPETVAEECFSGVGE